MKVAQSVELRKILRKNAFTYKVIKNRLALRALGEKCPEALRPFFQKPTAIAFADKDPIRLAKILKDFSNQGKILAVKGGQVEGQLMPAEPVRRGHQARLPQGAARQDRLPDGQPAPPAHADPPGPARQRRDPSRRAQEDEKHLKFHIN